MDALNGVPPPAPGSSAHVTILEHLYRQLRDALCRQAWRFTGCTEEAEDVIQDVFEHLLLRPASPTALTRAYLFQAVRNKARDHSRRAANALRYVELVTAEECYLAPSAAEVLDLNTLADNLDRAIAALPPRYRQAFLLTVVEGMAYAEAGAAMGISPHTVRQLVRRARCRLREGLAEYSAKMAAGRS